MPLHTNLPFFQSSAAGHHRIKPLFSRTVFSISPHQQAENDFLSMRFFYFGEKVEVMSKSGE
jgi:hypothetical protein